MNAVDFYTIDRSCFSDDTQLQGAGMVKIPAAEDGDIDEAAGLHFGFEKILSEQ